MSHLGEAPVRRSLAFNEPTLERDFQAELAATNGPQARTGILVAIFLWLAGALLVQVAATSETALLVASICIVMAALNLGARIVFRWATTLDRQQVLGLLLNVASGVAVLALAEILDVTQTLAAPAILLVAIFAFVVLRLRFIFALGAAVTYLIGFTAIVVVHPGGTAILQLFLVTAAVIVGLGATYLLERGARDVYAQRRIIEAQTAALAAEQATSERLLLNVLPASIAQRLAAGESSIADWFDDATVLFADIVGFTQLAARLEPRATRDLLDQLFRGFDELAERHGLEKIKTIGDAYMVVGGVPEPSSDHPARVVAMAIDMLDQVTVLGAQLGLGLDLRIGVHTGPVVAGVVGTRKFSYDLWGDTVNLASRLEAHGIAGAIQMSETTWLRVRDGVEATPRAPIELRGWGPMATYLVTRPIAMAAPTAAAVES